MAVDGESGAHSGYGGRLPVWSGHPGTKAHGQQEALSTQTDSRLLQRFPGPL